MAKVGASVALQTFCELGSNEKEKKEVKDHVMSLLSQLSRMNFINSNHSEMGEQTEKPLPSRYLEYKIENGLETFVVDVAVMLKKNEEGFIKRSLRKLLPKDTFVLKHIKAYNSSVNRFRDLYLDPHPIRSIGNTRDEPLVASQGQSWLRQTYPRGIEEHFVGMEDELKKLVSLVIQKKEPVISIFGEAGLGKTTMARKIYKHRDVRRCFDAFAWVCLSQGRQISSSTIQDILRQLTPREVNEITTEDQVDLVDRLQQVQRRERCFIVLDNIQDMDQLRLLKRPPASKNKGIQTNIQHMDRFRHLISALEMEGNRTVILLTARGKDIVDHGVWHELRLLNEDEAWDLLKKHAFPRNDGPDVGLFPRLGKEMVEKCGYLPSAISRLGKILSSNSTLGDWNMINNNVSEHLVQNHQTKEDEQPATDLDWNYKNLPYHLKQCFLYLGNFSEDAEIDVEDLYFLWIAEGMVSSVNEEHATQDTTNEDHREEITPEIANDSREATVLFGIGNEEEIMIKDTANGDRVESAMDRAEKYLTKLASERMVWVRQDELSPTRRSQSCFLYSPGRELSSWEEEKESSGIEVIDFCTRRVDYFYLDGFYAIRRMVIHFNQQGGHFPKLHKVTWKRIRSLFLINSGEKFVESPLKISHFKKFKLLRVLNFVRCKFDWKKLFEGIHDMLLNLRYLGFLYCDLDELPSSIGNLRNLRVLNVRALENYHLVIPNDFLHKLLHLNHLRLPYHANREETKKLKLGGLLELETLFGFNSLIHDIDSLTKLVRLRRLGAHAYSNASLKSLLSFIMLHGARIRTDLIIENKCDFTSKEGLAVLEEVLMCPNLHALTLSMVLIYKVPDCGTRLSSDLTQLKLIGCRIKEDPMEAIGKFPNLQKLCLGYGAFVGSEMAVKAGGFPKLEYLEIRSLPYFEEWRVDEGAACNLSDLIIRRCPRLKMIPDRLTSMSNLKNMEIELAPEAFEHVTEEEYRQKFICVPCCIIRKIKESFSTS